MKTSIPSAGESASVSFSSQHGGTWFARAGLVLLAVLLAWGRTAMAQSAYTWNGGSGASGNWSDGANWGGSGPANPQAFLNFNGATRLSSTNDFANGSAGYQIYFKSGANAFNLYGNSIIFYDFGGGDPNLQNEGAFTNQTINFSIVDGNTHGANGILNINLNTSTAQGPLIFNGNITAADAVIATRALNVSGTNAVAFNGAISDFSASGKMALTQLGTGTTTLNGSNTYTGDTTISAGNVTVGSGGRLGSGTYAGNMTDNGALVIGSTNSQTLSGNLSGTGTLTKNGTNLLTLSGANSHSGGTTLNTGGGININSTTALGTGSFTVGGSSTFFDNTTAGTITLANNNPLTLSGGSPTFTGTANLNFGSGTVTVSGANRTLTVTANTLTLGGGVTDAGGTRKLTKAGAGTLVLNGAAGTWTGGASVDGGTLTIGTDTTLGTGNLALNGGTLVAGNGARTLANPVTLTASSTIGGVNNLTFNGGLTNSGGSRTLTLTNSGTTTLAGNVYLSDDNTTGSRAMTITNVGQVVISGAIANNSAGNTVAAGLAYNGTTTLTLSGANTFTGAATLTGGTLIAANVNAFTTTAGVTLSGTVGTTTLDVQTDGGDAAYPINFGSAAVGSTIASDVKTGSVGINHTLGALSTGNATLNIVKGLNVTSGNPSITLGTVGVNAGTAGPTIMNPTTASLSLGAVSIALNNSAKTLQLDGTSTNNNVTGIIANGLNTLSLTKANTSTWTLTGANTYTGSTSVKQGTLIVSGSGSIIPASGAAGVINVGNTAALPGAMYQTGSGTVVSNSSGNFQIGSVAGAWGYYNLASGTMNLLQEIDVGGSGGGAGTFAQFDMSGGTVNLNAANPFFLLNRGAVGSSSVVNLSAGTVQIAGSATPADNLINGLSVNWVNTTAIPDTNVMTLSGTGQFLTPSLRVKLNQGSSFTGITGAASNICALNLNGGTLQTLGFLNSSTTANNANVRVNFNGGTLKAGSAGNTTFLQTLGGAYIYSGGATIDDNGQAITIGQPLLAPAANGVTAIAISTVGSGYVVPPQVMVAGGGNTNATAYATLTNGSLSGIVVTCPGTGYAGGVPPAVTLGAVGATTAATIGAVTLGANTGGGLTKLGSGTVTLTGASTFTGPVNVGAGTLYPNPGNAANNRAFSFVSGITVSNGATLQSGINGLFGWDGTQAKPITVNTGGTLTIDAANNDVNVGTVTLNGGTLAGGPSVAWGSFNFKRVAGGKIVATDNSTVTATDVGLGPNNYVDVSAGKTLTWSGALHDATSETPAAGTLIKFNGTGSLLLSGVNTHSGGTTVSNGAVIIGNNSALGTGLLSMSGGSLTNNGTTSYTVANNGNFVSTAPIGVGSGAILTMSGVVTNTGGLIKSGAGTLTLSGANTYTGTTTISNGTLALSGSGLISSSPIINVNGGATFDVSAISFTLGGSQVLNGNGTVSGNVATASGASIQPGASPGTLTFANNLDLTGGGTTIFELSTSAGGGNDQIVVSGNLTLNNSTVIHISALSGAANLDTNADYVLCSVAGTTTMAPPPSLIWDGTQPGNYLNYTLVKTGNNVVLRYVSATAPTLTAAASLTTATRNQPFALTATVTNGSGNIVSVTADLSPVGGSATSSLVLSSNNIFTNTFAVRAGTTTGTKSITVTVTDDTTPTPLVGTFVITPFSIVVTNQTWNGADTNDNFTSSANWLSSWAPGYTNDSLTFDGTARLTPNMDTNYSVTGVTFNSSAGSFTVGTANGSTLTFTGSGVTNNSANSQTLNVPMTMSAAQTFNAAAGNLTLAGNVASGGNLTTVIGVSNTAMTGGVSGGGSLFKQGTGSLTISSNGTWGGTAASSGGFSGPLVAQGGTTLFNGGTNNVGGELVIGGVVTNGGAGQNAKITVDGATLNISSWLSVGRGNGLGGVSSDLVLTNTATATAANFSAGYNGANGANLPKGSVTLYNSSSLVITSALNLAESAGSDVTMTLNNSSSLVDASTSVKFLGEFGKGTLNINDSSSVALGNAITYIGYQSGTGIVSIASSGTLVNAGELQVGGSDLGGTGLNANGTLTVSGGTVNLGTLTVARGNNNQNGCSGTVTVNGGTLTSTNDIDLGFAGTGTAVLNIGGGTVNVGPTALKWLKLGTYDFTRGQINISSGNLNLLNNSSIKFSDGVFNTTLTTNVISQTGGTLGFYSDAGTTLGGTGVLDMQTSVGTSIRNTYNLDGGSLIVPQLVASASNGTRIFNFNGGNLKAAAAGTAFLAGGVATTANVRNGGAVVDSGSFNITIGQALVHSTIAGDNVTDGGLTKNGSGTLTLSGTNTYTGATSVSNGTLLVTGIISTNTVTVGSGGTLSGTGGVNGAASVQAGGTLQAGLGGVDTSTITISNTLTLAGNVQFNLNRTNAPTANNVAGLTALTLGGTLTVTNVGSVLQAGDGFTLFSTPASGGSFAVTNLPVLGAGQNWWTTNNYASLIVNQVAAGSVTNTRTKGFGLKIKIADLLTNASSLPAGGDTFALAGVGSSTNGATLSTNGTYIFFTPGTGSSSNSNESFSYTIADARGGSATGNITINVLTTAGGPQTISVSGSTATVNFAGIPGYTYAVQRSTNLVDWVTRFITNAPTAGLFNFTDDFSDLGGPPASAYYRTAQP